MNILLMGYYGQRNIGDDLFVKQLSNYFSRRSDVVNIFILCKEEYYPKNSEKVTFYCEEKLSKLQKLLLILKSDRIFWGGGTLNIRDRPTNLLRIQFLSRLMGKKFGFLGIGLEAVDAEVQEESYNIFQKSSLLYLRDRSSYDIASNYFENKEAISLGGDLAFIDLNIYHNYIQSKTNNQLQNISFSGKFWWGEGRGEFYANQLLPVIEKYNSVIHLLPGHVGTERNDNQFHERLKKYLPQQNYQLHSWEEPEEFIEILSTMDFHFGNRLHSIILADILGVPNIGIDRVGSKIGNYIEKTNLLVEERRVDFMEEIGLDRIERILNQYVRPAQFISHESEQAKNCLEKV